MSPTFTFEYSFWFSPLRAPLSSSQTPRQLLPFGELFSTDSLRNTPINSLLFDCIVRVLFIVV